MIKIEKHVVDFIKKARWLIYQNKYRFVPRNYSGMDYITVLLNDFGISLNEAVEQLKTINAHMYVPDDKPTYSGSGCYVFKKLINNSNAYIKLKLEEEEDGECLVIISFHGDY